MGENCMLHRVPPAIRSLVLAAFWIGLTVGSDHTWAGDLEGEARQAVPACAFTNQYFEEQVWAKVGERTCIRCHTASGDASESGLLLMNPADPRGLDSSWMDRNREAFRRVASAKEGDQFRLLLKVTGGLEHGGGQVLKPDSTGYRILERYVKHTNGLAVEPVAEPVTDLSEAPFFDGVAMISPGRLVRRLSLSLCGRLPSGEELAALKARGPDALDGILDQMMKEEAFYTRLKEGFNDIFLTLGIEDNAETILSYDHFETTRQWTEKHDLNHVPEADRQKARWALADVYRQSLLREPLELIAYIVRNERPFTELATADYIMVSPYSARGYGIFEELKGQFQNVDDPQEYIPAKLNALKSREGKTQESATGLYPHAGFLSMFHYLHRYPSTETNRNRLRARMFYQHFLGIDIMQLAPRTSDASAVAAKFKVPTMEAQDCVVCHKTIDPVAGIFQDFNFEGNLGPRKEGWYTDMFGAGFEGEAMPALERWRAPQWLGERVARDPRFPIAMVEHVYSLMMGRKVLQAPDDIDSPTFPARRKAYWAQRRMIEGVASQFKDAGFNLKMVFKALAQTDFYRADGHLAATVGPQRRAELDDLGIVRLLAPEQLERKLQAIFGKPWGRLNDELRILYGGIDSQTVTERNADPSGAMGAIQRIMANDMACLHVAKDFRLPANQRTLFPGIEPTVVPGDGMSDLLIRKALVDMHQRLLGSECTATDPEVERSFLLFTGIVGEAKSRGNFEPKETYFCGGREEFRADDPHYTLRAWRAVVTYLLRQQDFLYE